MKLTIAVFAAVAVLSATEPQARKKASAAPVPTPKVIQPLQIPAGAVETELNTFRYTDPKGKKWIYHKTPFGVARAEDVPETAVRTLTPAERGDDVKASEDGDTVRFERPSPFGVYKWQVKKSELSGMEQAVWNRQQAAQQSTAKQD